MPFGHAFVYIVRCADGSLFTGTAEDPDATLVEINSGSGETYTKTRRPAFLVYNEEFMNLKDAERRAMHVRAMTRREKEHLVSTAGAAETVESWAGDVFGG